MKTDWTVKDTADWSTQHFVRPRSRVEEWALTVTTMEIITGLRQLLAPSSRRVPDYLRMGIRDEGIVSKVYDEVLPH
jgi:hypothetical protein